MLSHIFGVSSRRKKMLRSEERIIDSEKTNKLTPQHYPNPNPNFVLPPLAFLIASSLMHGFSPIWLQIFLIAVISSNLQIGAGCHFFDFHIKFSVGFRSDYWQTMPLTLVYISFLKGGINHFCCATRCIVILKNNVITFQSMVSEKFPKSWCKLCIFFCLLKSEKNVMPEHFFFSCADSPIDLKCATDTLHEMYTLWVERPGKQGIPWQICQIFSVHTHRFVFSSMLRRLE